MKTKILISTLLLLVAGTFSFAGESSFVRKNLRWNQKQTKVEKSEEVSENFESSSTQKEEAKIVENKSAVPATDKKTEKISNKTAKPEVLPEIQPDAELEQNETVAVQAPTGDKTAAQIAYEKNGSKWYRLTLIPSAFSREPVSEMIFIDTIPSGATVVVNDKVAGTTPLSVEYRRKKAPVVVLKKEGFPDQQLRIRRSLNRSAWRDSFLSLLVVPMLWTHQNWTYDVGCMLRYSENNVVVELQDFENVKSVRPKNYKGHVELRPWKKR